LDSGTFLLGLSSRGEMLDGVRFIMAMFGDDGSGAGKKKDTEKLLNLVAWGKENL